MSVQEVFVTTLADDGQGSLREAIKVTGPTHIRFKVSGNIVLQSRLWLGEPHTFVDASDAPGPVVISNDTVYVRANHVILKQLIVAAGRYDCAKDSLWITGCENVWVNECTLMYGSDEVCSATNTNNVLITNCFILAALNYDEHAFGSLLATNDEHGVIYVVNNVFMSNASRNPAISQGNFLVASNWIYNYGYRALYSSSSQNTVALVVNNRFTPSTSTRYPTHMFRFPDNPSPCWLWLEDNVVEGYPDETADNRLGVVNVNNGFMLERSPDKRRGRYLVLPDEKRFAGQHDLNRFYRRLDRLCVKLEDKQDPVEFDLASPKFGAWKHRTALVDTYLDEMRQGTGHITNLPYQWSLPPVHHEGTMPASKLRKVEVHARSILRRLLRAR